MEFRYQFPNDVMTDPSLILSDQHVWDTYEIVSNQEILDFYLPQTFQEYLEEEGYQAYQLDESERPPLLKYYSQYAEVPNLSDVSVMVSNIFATFEASEYTDKYSLLYKSLAETLPYSGSRPPTEECRYGSDLNRLVDSVFEELVFLLERSGWVSRTKRVINDAIDAGVHFIELSEDRVDDFLSEHTKTQDEVKKDLLKEIGKWIAVSTTGIATGLYGGPLFGLVSATTVDLAADATLLLVFDP